MLFKGAFDNAKPDAGTWTLPARVGWEDDGSTSSRSGTEEPEEEGARERLGRSTGLKAGGRDGGGENAETREGERVR